jgi:integral membrane protein
MSLFNLFRIVAILEGISYLMLFAITMPLKYMYDMPTPNQYVGYAHGFLFVAYCIFLVIVGSDKNFTKKIYLLSFIAALLPFGTFVAEAKIFSKYANA